MKFSDHEWSELSRLLDEVLALPEAERPAWLEAVPVLSICRAISAAVVWPRNPSL